MGGLKRKNNLAVCKAINKIKNIKIKFTVIGPLGKDGEEVKNYKFVEYYEYLPHEEVMKKMRQSHLYIQNSYFETFGLAVFEALTSGCKILVSENVGALSIIENMETIIIHDNNNINEIMEKIVYQYEHKNERFDYIKERERHTWENSAQKIKKILENKEDER